MGALGSAVTKLATVGSALTSLGSAYSAVRSVSSIKSPQAEERERSRELADEQGLALKQLRDSQDNALRSQEEDAAQQRAQIMLDAQGEERERRAALRRAVARQKVAFADQGIGADASDGSPQAVLLGLYDESEDEKADRDRLDNVRLSLVDQNLEQQKRLNILQRQQLQERQNLERIYQDG